MGKKIVSSFRNVLAKVGENWIEAMKYLTTRDECSSR